jgi:hypothetical protein
LKCVATKTKGTLLELDGADFAMEESWQHPDKVRREINLTEGGKTSMVIHVFNGERGWVCSNGATREISHGEKLQLNEAMHCGAAQVLDSLCERGYKLKALGESKVGDKAALGLKVVCEGRRDVSLFFDKRTGLLLKSERKTKIVLGGMDVTYETFFEDYKEVNGIQQPHRFTIYGDGKKCLECEITEVVMPEKFDEKTFEKP